MNSHRQEGIKELVKTYLGCSYGIKWKIKIYLTDDGRYLGVVDATLHDVQTVLADNTEEALANAARTLNELIEMGVGNAA